MINTLYSLDALGSPVALFLALVIGFGFGFALERAGFSSSRRLAGVFYFTDMAVVKVMFTAVVTAMLGLSYLVSLGWIRLDQIFLMPTIYGAQIVGGLLFGAGFVMGGWCPGTAAAGMAAGRMDALVFLIGSVGGSILFNEAYPLMKPLYTAGDQGVLMVYGTLGMSRNVFVLVFTLVAVGAFWLSEWAEKKRNGRAPYLGSSFLKAFSFMLVLVAAGLFVLGPLPEAVIKPTSAGAAVSGEAALMADVWSERDHMEPEELADRLIAGGADLVVVDVRPPSEFAAFHIRGAINIALPALEESLRPHKNKGMIVLYSNGMTHPAQARDSLQRQGFDNVYMLTDGLQGFHDRCLKPVSLRLGSLSDEAARRVNAWRAFFAASPAAGAGTKSVSAAVGGVTPRFVDTAWLASRIGAEDVKVVDLRPQPEYNTAHIPGSLSLNVESLRGNVGGVPSMLLPAQFLAATFSLMGVQPSDTVVFVASEKFHDATLAGMALERLGHVRFAVLSGSYAKWLVEGRSVDARLPEVKSSAYPVPQAADDFSVDFRYVADRVGRPGVVIIDVRPADFFAGLKTDEARAGHIPGAVSRPYTEDVTIASNKVVALKPVEVLAAAYSRIIPSKDTEVIVHCRTGHQASQTYQVLRHVLGYKSVRWYDAGWTEWAARSELPIVTAGKVESPAK